MVDGSGAERLQKYLARCGLGSRRACEGLITGGRVKVNGSTISKLGTKVEAGLDMVEVDGRHVTPEEKSIYIALNKPVGYLTAVSDDRGRPVVTDLVKGIRERVYPVGRLDLDSEGLVLLTNDGELANTLMHPSYHVKKEYLVGVEGSPSRDAISSMAAGVLLDGRKTSKASIIKLDSVEGVEESLTFYRVAIYEGRNRQIRRMFAAVGSRVRLLRRVAIGAVRLGSLAPGRFRPLDSVELRELRAKKLSGKG